MLSLHAHVCDAADLSLVFMEVWHDVMGAASAMMCRA